MSAPNGRKNGSGYGRTAPSPARLFSVVTTPDLLISPERGLKMVDPGLDGGPLIMEGPLVVFSGPDSPDLEGDFFTAKTDFGPLSDVGEATVAAYYHHGLDEDIGRERIGTARLKMTDAAVWARYQITKRKDYLRRLAEAEADDEVKALLGGAGVLGQSSGALTHTFDAERVSDTARWIKSWTIGEASPTPEPAEPRTSVLPIKSLFGYARASESEAASVLRALRREREGLQLSNALRAARLGLHADTGR